MDQDVLGRTGQETARAFATAMMLMGASSLLALGVVVVQHLVRRILALIDNI